MLEIFLLLAAVSGFDESLDQRLFEDAWSAAGESDSLRAEVLSAAGYGEAALLLHTIEWAGNRSPASFLRVWSEMTSLDPSPLLTDLFREQLSLVFDMEWTSDELRDLWETGFILEDSVTLCAVEERIFTHHPNSEAAAAVAGDLFYDCLYPVWYDDSARVEVLEGFIAEYGEYSDYWRSKAFRYQLSAVTSTADSTQWPDYLHRWLESCPGDPVACLTGTSLYIGRDSSWAEGLALAEEGLIHCSGWNPVGLDPAEHAIEAPALHADLLFRKTRCLFELGRTEEAVSLLSPLLDPGMYPPDDHHTTAAYFWLSGEISLEQGDTTAAITALIRSASQGDVVNRWAGKSEQRLAELTPGGQHLLEWCRDTSGYGGPVFEDVTGLLGPDSILQGSRVAWGDYDGDGYPDLLLGRNLYWNRRGSGFENVTDPAGLGDNTGSGGVFGDLDLDGDLDIVTSGMPVQVFRNDNGVFTDVTSESGIQHTGYRVEGTGLLDWNGDGWLDVYLASYEKPGELAQGTPDRLYLGSSEGFREVSDSLGMEPFLGEDLCGRGVSPCDFDRDGDVDIFVSNYRLQENFLWRNDSSGSSNTALTAGLTGHETDGWWGHTIGSAWGDFDCDGDWDLFSANLAHPRYIGISDRSELLENMDGVFEDRRSEAGIRFEETHSNPLWGDFDNDGWLDLYVTSIYSDRRSFLYLGSEDGTFTDVTFLSGARVFNGWGAAAADFDRDGRLDLAVGSSTGPRLLRNLTEPSGYWILIEVVPEEGVNGSATGSIVEISDGRLTWLRQVEGGSGTTSQPEGILHFGLPGSGPYTWKLSMPGLDGFREGVVSDLNAIIRIP